jgi:hypothetical protein
MIKREVKMLDPQQPTEANALTGLELENYVNLKTYDYMRDLCDVSAFISTGLFCAYTAYYGGNIGKFRTFIATSLACLLPKILVETKVADLAVKHADKIRLLTHISHIALLNYMPINIDTLLFELYRLSALSTIQALPFQIGLLSISITKKVGGLLTAIEKLLGITTPISDNTLRPIGDQIARYSQQFKEQININKLITFYKIPISKSTNAMNNQNCYRETDDDINDTQRSNYMELSKKSHEAPLSPLSLLASQPYPIYFSMFARSLCKSGWIAHNSHLLNPLTTISLSIIQSYFYPQWMNSAYSLSGGSLVFGISALLNDFGSKDITLSFAERVVSNMPSQLFFLGLDAYKEGINSDLKTVSI